MTLVTTIIDLTAPEPHDLADLGPLRRDYRKLGRERRPSGGRRRRSGKHHSSSGRRRRRQNRKH